MKPWEILITRTARN